MNLSGLVVDIHHFTVLKKCQNVKNGPFGLIVDTHHFTVLKSAKI